MREKLSENDILRCGFKYEYYLPKTYVYTYKHGETTFNVWRNMIFYLTVNVYDYELDGEIQIEYRIFKKNRSYWVLLYNNTYEIINTLDDLKRYTGVSYDSVGGFVYLIKSKYGYKIGRTSNISDRASIFNVKLPFRWIFERIYCVKNSYGIERFLHVYLTDYNINGEWFDLNGEMIQEIDKFIYQTQQVPLCP